MEHDGEQEAETLRRQGGERAEEHKHQGTLPDVQGSQEGRAQQGHEAHQGPKSSRVIASRQVKQNISAGITSGRSTLDSSIVIALRRTNTLSSFEHLGGAASSSAGMP